VLGCLSATSPEPSHRSDIDAALLFAEKVVRRSRVNHLCHLLCSYAGGNPINFPNMSLPNLVYLYVCCHCLAAAAASLLPLPRCRHCLAAAIASLLLLRPYSHLPACLLMQRHQWHRDSATESGHISEAANNVRRLPTHAWHDAAWTLLQPP